MGTMAGCGAKTQTNRPETSKEGAADTQAGPAKEGTGSAQPAAAQSAAEAGTKNGGNEEKPKRHVKI